MHNIDKMNIVRDLVKFITKIQKIQTAILWLEVKVESSFESVQLQFAGGKEPGRGGSGGVDPGGGDHLGSASGLLGDIEASLVSGEVSSEVGSIEGVDERVDALTVSAVGDQACGQGLGDTGGVLGGELGAVLVESKVAVGGIVGVDEGVPVGVLFNLFIIVIPVRNRSILISQYSLYLSCSFVFGKVAQKKY